MYSAACIENVLDATLRASGDPDAATAGRLLLTVDNLPSLHVLADRLMSRGLECGEYLASWLAVVEGADPDAHLAWFEQAATDTMAWAVCERPRFSSAPSFTRADETGLHASLVSARVSVGLPNSGPDEHLLSPTHWVFSGVVGVWALNGCAIRVRSSAGYIAELGFVRVK